MRRALRKAPAACFVIAVLAAGALSPARAQQSIACGAFTDAPLAAPEPRPDPHSRARLAEIDAAVKAAPHRVIFFGDSITERWQDREGESVWRDRIAPLGVLNAGINGDRTEHLLWRLEHGNLDGPAPQAMILLIGTNDLGHGRPPALAAEGIRADLLRLRAQVPRARVLLLGLLPRERLPDAPLRREVSEVNRLIATCADGKSVIYADIGGVLLDPNGVLSPAISPDRLHFTAAGYARLAAPLVGLIGRLLAP